jgi:hypothetical protein
MTGRSDQQCSAREASVDALRDDEAGFTRGDTLTKPAAAPLIPCPTCALKKGILQKGAL